ncbi:MAG: colicin import membrane protein, partial [Psychroserpens sp.]
MKYLETKHEQNSAKITALIAVILVLLLFVMGTNYMDPPEEYGVAINFG